VTRTKPCDLTSARTRLRHARAYFDVGDLVLDEDDAAVSTVAVGVFVLAGIAAADAICCARLGERAPGQSHDEARRLLDSATADGKRLADLLAKLLNLKTSAHYGDRLLSSRQAKDARRWASQLLARADEETSR
jgi:hypothetical protein